MTSTEIQTTQIETQIVQKDLYGNQEKAKTRTTQTI